VNKKLWACALILISLNLYAQEESSPKPDAPATEGKPDLAFPDKNKKIQLNFSDELVHGNHDSSDSLFMMNKNPASMKKLIRIRENFNSNMGKSKNEFKSR
jgi:hypothetical protein